MLFFDENKSGRSGVSGSINSFLNEMVKGLNPDQGDRVVLAYDEKNDSLDKLTSEEVSDFNKILAEAVPKTTRKVVVKTRVQKLALMKQKASMELAKESRDALYIKYEKARKLEIAIRKKIEKKYKSKAMAAVRAAMQAKKPAPKK
jgi:uncharacterized membrane protein